MHINDATHGGRSNLPAIENECSSPSYMLQGTQTDTATDLPACVTDSQHQTTASADTNTENVTIFTPSETHNCTVQPATQITNTANVTSSFSTGPSISNWSVSSACILTY